MGVQGGQDALLEDIQMTCLDRRLLCGHLDCKDGNVSGEVIMTALGILPFSHEREGTKQLLAAICLLSENVLMPPSPIARNIQKCTKGGCWGQKLTVGVVDFGEYSQVHPQHIECQPGHDQQQVKDMETTAPPGPEPSGVQLEEEDPLCLQSNNSLTPWERG